jgi:hypothetical protein
MSLFHDANNTFSMATAPPTAPPSPPVSPDPTRALPSSPPFIRIDWAKKIHTTQHFLAAWCAFVAGIWELFVCGCGGVFGGPHHGVFVWQVEHFILHSPGLWALGRVWRKKCST